MGFHAKPYIHIAEGRQGAGYSNHHVTRTSVHISNYGIMGRQWRILLAMRAGGLFDGLVCAPPTARFPQGL
jgi:hypothetical protein